MSGPEGNSWFCFPESLDVSRDEVEGNIENRGKTKLTSFPRDQTLSALLYIQRMNKLKKRTKKNCVNYSTPEHNFISSIKYCKCKNTSQTTDKRKQRTDLVSMHFRNPSALKVFLLRFSNKK